VQAVRLLHGAKLLRRRIDQADPYELRLVLGAVDPLTDRHRADAFAVVVEVGGDDGHACP